MRPINRKRMSVTKTFLISRPQWVNQEYYERAYASVVYDAFAQGHRFVLGSAAGVDTFAQHQLALLARASGDFESAMRRVSIFCKEQKDGRLYPEFGLENGFTSFPERDLAMVEKAEMLIVFLPQYGSGVSGTMLVVEAMALKNFGVAAWKLVARTLEVARRAVVPRDRAETEVEMQRHTLATVQTPHQRTAALIENVVAGSHAPCPPKLSISPGGALL